MLKPTEVLEALQWLRQGRLRQAAEALQKSTQPQHRDVVQARHDVARKLFESARRLAASGEISAALADALLAAELAQPTADEAALLGELQRIAGPASTQGPWHVLEQAEQWFHEGRYAEVVDLCNRIMAESGRGIPPALQQELAVLKARAESSQRAVAKDLQRIRETARSGEIEQAWAVVCEAVERLGPADELKSEQRRIGRKYLEALCRSIEEHIARGNLTAAGTVLRRARHVESLVGGVGDAKLDALQERLAAHRPHRCGSTGATAPPRQPGGTAKPQSSDAAPGRPVFSRHSVFVLQHRWLVVSDDCVTIGHRTSPAAHVRLAARLTRAHTQILRHEGHYYVQPLVHDPSPAVRVNGEPVRRLRRLRHRDRLEFSNARGAWVFALPVDGSPTAVLFMQDPSGANVVLRHGSSRHVVLLADRLVCDRENRPDAHVVLDQLPGRLVLQWQPEGLFWHTDRCVHRSHEDDPGTDHGPVTVPSRLNLQRQASEFEWLQEALQHGQDIERPVSISFEPAY
ncbi:MAG: hypothetical protein D6725_03585 [Planctomycetota bacterium]|nr:MAG: hypothetical protein D6725_03585 [Planctomycetota bacterium]